MDGNPWGSEFEEKKSEIEKVNKKSRLRIPLYGEDLKRRYFMNENAEKSEEEENEPVFRRPQTVFWGIFLRIRIIAIPVRRRSLL